VSAAPSLTVIDSEPYELPRPRVGALPASAITVAEEKPGLAPGSVALRTVKTVDDSTLATAHAALYPVAVVTPAMTTVCPTRKP